MLDQKALILHVIIKCRCVDTFTAILRELRFEYRLVPGSFCRKSIFFEECCECGINATLINIVLLDLAREYRYKYTACTDCTIHHQAAAHAVRIASRPSR